MFKHHLISTYRNLLRNKINTFINVVGLAISLACCIAIYVFVKHEKSFDSFHSNAERVFRVVSDVKSNQGTFHQGITNFALATALRNDFPFLKTVSQVYTDNKAIVAIKGTNSERNLFEENGMAYADEFFLKTFRYKLLSSSSLHLLTSPDEVVLTKKLADKFFGKQYQAGYNELVGKTVTINNRDYRISGILQDIPGNTNVAFTMLLPFKAFFRDNPKLINNWRELYSGCYTFISLPEGHKPEQLDAKLFAFKNKYLDPEEARAYTFRLQPLKEVHSDETYGGTRYATPQILIIAFVSMGIIVLLAACINFINLATAQSLQRAKEIGIRKTLGSRRWELIVRFLSETFILVVIASLAGLFLASYFVDSFNRYLSFIVDFGLRIDVTVIYFLVVLIIITTLLAGFYPAKVMAGYQPIMALKQTVSGKKTGFAGGFSLRKVLVVIQFTVSQLLIIGTIIVASQMHYFRSRDLGYDKDRVLTVEIPENNEQKLSVFRTQLLSQPQIENVTFSSGPPTSASNSTGLFRLKSARETEEFSMERKFIDANYISAYNIRLIAGRDLKESDKVFLTDSGNKYNVVLNHKAINALGFKDPSESIGHTIVVNDKDDATIVGVVNDFFNVPLQQEISPCLLFYGTNWVGMASIRLSSTESNNAGTLAFIEKNWKHLFPEHIYKAMSINDYIKLRAFYIMEDIMYQAFKIFAGLAVLIGCLGLYGLVSFLALQRQKEIGIRKVLGASVSGIVYMFSKEFVLLIVIAFVVAVPVGYVAMSGWLESFANRIELTPGFFFAAFILSLVIAGITVSFQAIKAAVTNPVKSLRTE